MWTSSASTGARACRTCAACSGPARRCRAISIRLRCLRRPPSCAGTWMRCSRKRAARPDTFSTSGTASGPTPTPTRLRAWSTTSMSGASDLAAPATAYFRGLQARLCAAFEAFEPLSRFQTRSSTKPEGHRLHGGGEPRLVRGEGFEKVGVNVSHVWGVLAPEAHAQVAGARESEGRFVACRSEERRVGKECRSRWSPY